MIYHLPVEDKGLGCSLSQHYAEIANNNVDGTPSADSVLMLTTQYKMVLSCQFFT